MKSFILFIMLSLVGLNLAHAEKIRFLGVGVIDQQLESGKFSFFENQRGQLFYAEISSDGYTLDDLQPVIDMSYSLQIDRCIAWACPRRFVFHDGEIKLVHDIFGEGPVYATLGGLDGAININDIDVYSSSICPYVENHYDKRDRTADFYRWRGGYEAHHLSSYSPEEIAHEMRPFTVDCLENGQYVLEVPRFSDSGSYRPDYILSETPSVRDLESI